MSNSTPNSPSAVAAAHPASANTEKDDAVPPITSSTSPSTNTTRPPPPPVQKQELSSNPKIAELQSIFPTVDVSVIELVLFETCGGSSDRAIEQLLGMTDENFRPDELERTREDSQVDLDAEFARSLQLQDEEDLRRQQQQLQSQQAQGGGGGVGGGLPYQPRVRRARPVPSDGDTFYQPQHQQQQGYQNRDTRGQGGENPPGMLALEDKLEKYAEVGKQTFNSFLSRAKAKYSEYQASQAQRTNTNYTTPTAQGGDGGYGERYAPGGSRGGEQGRGLWGDINAHSPSVRSESISSESTLDPPYQQQPPSQAQPIRGSQRWQPTDTYDDPLPPPRGPVITSPNRIDVVGRSSSNAGMGGRGSPGIGSPEKGKIDPAKLGILPKKKVDLFSTSPNQTTMNTEQDDPNPSLPNAHQSLVSKIPQTPPASSDNRYRLEDSDDELEYTKNPFDEK